MKSKRFCFWGERCWELNPRFLCTEASTLPSKLRVLFIFLFLYFLAGEVAQLVRCLRKYKHLSWIPSTCEKPDAVACASSLKGEVRVDC